MPLRRWLAGAILGVCALFVAVLPAQEAPVQPLVTVRTGTLPIILSAPHGGAKAVPGVPVRKGGDGIKQFVTGRDSGTADLAEKLAAAIEKKMKGKPYVVIARFDRKYIDANRPDKGAYESDKAKPFYDAYHHALRKARTEVQSKWRGGLLLDLHGQGADAEAIFRGTASGKSVTHLVERFGKPALTGPKSVLGVLAKNGYKVIPANTSADKEDRRYNGGYITQTYGSRDGGTVDAIQLELGGKLRNAKNAAKTAADIADAVAVFAKEYLPAEKLQAP